MKTSPFALALLLLPLHACAPGRGVVTLTVTSNAAIAGITALDVIATFEGQSPLIQTVTLPAGRTTIPPALRIAVVFNERYEGIARLEVVARSAAGELARGGTTVEITPSGSATATIFLGESGDAGVAYTADMADGGMKKPRDMADAGHDLATADADMADPTPVGLWAGWRMPNPVASALPNPASYDTTTPGIVKDNVTGLVWQRVLADNVNGSTWANAKTYCQGLALAGGGWRLPGRIELVSLVEFTRSNPAIDPVVFPNTPASGFWSSSPLAGNPTNAWNVNFNNGNTNNNDITNTLRVRCVR